MDPCDVRQMEEGADGQMGNSTFHICCRVRKK